MMKSSLAAFLVFSTLSATAVPVFAAPPATPAAADAKTKPYATVNGFAIPQYVVDAFINEQKARGATATDGAEFKKAVHEEMIRRGALISEAKKRGLDKRPDFRQQLEIASQLVLMRSVVADYLEKNPVNDAELQTAYNSVIVQLGSSEYKIRHIQLKTEDAAKDIIARLANGKKFDKLVKESTDQTTKENGGDLGWKAPHLLPAPAGDAIKKLAKAEYTTTPVQTSAGYHVILVEDIRPLTPPSLNELKPKLAQSVIQLKVAKFIEDLKNQAVVK
jgi:peptidyl-prolyl cis-trans isomerase C